MLCFVLITAVPIAFGFVGFRVTVTFVSTRIPKKLHKGKRKLYLFSGLNLEPVLKIKKFPFSQNCSISERKLQHAITVVKLDKILKTNLPNKRCDRF